MREYIYMHMCTGTCVCKHAKPWRGHPVSSSSMLAYASETRSLPELEVHMFSTKLEDSELPGAEATELTAMCRMPGLLHGC